MDPEFINQSDWSNLGGLLRFLWVYVFLAIGVAANFLMAHAIVPSLVTTHHLPERALRLRPLFYGAAGGAFCLAVITMIVLVARAAVIADFYERWWI